MKQATFASLAWQAKGRTTRRERFLAEISGREFGSRDPEAYIRSKRR